MNVYNYDPHTFLYVGTSKADESPLEPGVFLIPAHSTIIEPLVEKDGYKIAFENQNWIYKPIIVELEDVEELNKQKLLEVELRAKSGLFNSDWVLQSDVNISNIDEWLKYRALLRAIAIQPTIDAVIPDKPGIVWS